MSKRRTYLACVSVRYDSDYVIKTARCIAEDDAGAGMTVISVLTGAPDAGQLEALEHLHEAAREADAPMTILYNNSPILAAVEYIKRHKVTHVIAGMPSSGESEGDFITLLRAVLPKVCIILVPRTVSLSSEAQAAQDNII